MVADVTVVVRQSRATPRSWHRFVAQGLRKARLGDSAWLRPLLTGTCENCLPKPWCLSAAGLVCLDVTRTSLLWPREESNLRAQIRSLSRFDSTVRLQR